MSETPLHTYTVDGYTVEFLPDTDAVEPVPGEYRLLSVDGKDLAHSFWDRGQEHFARGDEELFEFWHLKDAYEEYDGSDEDFQDEHGISERDLDDLRDTPKPYRVEVSGHSQGDYSFTYFPSDTADTEEQRRYTAQLLANYSFGDIYYARVTCPDETVGYINNFEDAWVDNSETDTFLRGQASDDEIRALLREYSIL